MVATLARASRAASASAAIARCRFSGTRTSFTWTFAEEEEDEGSGLRYPGFLIEWIFCWIESSQIESIFELNFPRKKFIE